MKTKKLFYRRAYLNYTFTDVCHRRAHVESAGHTCELRDASEFQSSAEVAKLVTQEPFDGALAIHLYKAGRLLLGNSTPSNVFSFQITIVLM